MANVFDLSAKLSLDRGDFEKGLDDAESSLGKFGSAMGSFVGGAAKITTAALAAGAAGVSAMATMATASYADYEQLVGGIETLYGDAAGQMMDYARAAYETTGQSANEFMEAAISTSAAMITSVGGDQQKAAELTNLAMVDMADNANKLGTDMEAIQNAYKGFSKANFTMLDNLALGYAGTKEGMEKLLADAEAISGVKYDISSYADIVEAIHVIQEEMDIAGTTAREANETISGSLSATKAAWSNLVTGLADPEADIGALIGNMVESGSTFLDNLVPVVANALQGIGSAINELTPVLEEQLPTILEELLPILLESATTLVNGVVNALPSILTALTNAITKSSPMIIRTLMGLLPTLINTVIQIGIQIANVLPQIINQVQTALAGQMPTLIPTIVDGIIQIIGAFTENMDLIIEGGLLLIEGIGQGLIDSIPLLVDKLPQLIEGLTSGLSTYLPMIIDTGVQLLLGLSQAIKDATPIIVEQIPILITTLTDLIITFLPQIIEAGVTLLSALVENIDVITENVVAIAPDLVTAIVDAIIELTPQIIQGGFDLITALFDDSVNIISDLGESVGAIIGEVILKLGDFLQDFIDIGKKLFEGIGDGFDKAKDFVADKGKTALNVVKNFITGSLGINSPSTVFRDDVGYWIGAGIGVGIEESTDYVIDKAKALGDDTLDTLGDYADMDLDASVDLDKSINYSATSTLNTLVADTVREAISSMEFTVPVYIGNKRVEEMVISAVNTSDFRNGGRR